MDWREFNTDLAEQMQTSVREAELVMDAVVRLIREKLERGERVSFRNFGSFSVIVTERRRFRNPRTGEPIEAPAGKRVKFRASGAFREVMSDVVE